MSFDLHANVNTWGNADNLFANETKTFAVSTIEQMQSREKGK